MSQKIGKLLKQLMTTNVYFVLHIAKTAGTALSEVLGATPEVNFYSNRIGIPRDGYIEFYHKHKHENKPIVLMGHHIMNCHKDINVEPRYFTILRSPVERVISEYYFIKSRESHHLYKEATEIPLMEFTKGHRMDNGQSRSIVGHDEIIAEHYGGELDFRRIFDSLPRFLFIGLQDKLQESVNKICERIGIKDVPEHVSFKYGHTPFTDENKKHVSAEDLQEIENLNPFDIVLYEYVKRILWNRQLLTLQ